MESIYKLERKRQRPLIKATLTKRSTWFAREWLATLCKFGKLSLAANRSLSLIRQNSNSRLISKM
jgi:hypothetical protein